MNKTILGLLTVSALTSCGGESLVVGSNPDAGSDRGMGPPHDARPAHDATDASAEPADASEEPVTASDAGDGPSDCPGESGVVTLARGQLAPDAITVDSTSVYWLTQGDSLHPSTVVSVPRCGGAKVTLWTGSLGTGVGSGIAVGSGNVYWTGGSGVRAVPVAGGTSTLVSSKASYHLAIDSMNAYWTSYGPAGVVTKAPLLGGKSTKLATAPYATDVAVDSESVYFTSNAGVFKVPIAGGVTTTLWPGGAGGANLLAIDDSSVYWTASERGVMKVAKVGGAPITLATSREPQAIAVDASNVYWTDWSSCGVSCVTPESTIMKVPIDGGTTITLVAKQNLPDAIAVDDFGVYWLDNPQSGPGEVKKVTPK